MSYNTYRIAHKSRPVTTSLSTPLTPLSAIPMSVFSSHPSHLISITTSLLSLGSTNHDLTLDTGDTALHLAARGGHLTVCDLLATAERLSWRAHCDTVRHTPLTGTPYKPRCLEVKNAAGLRASELARLGGHVEVGVRLEGWAREIYGEEVAGGGEGGHNERGPGLGQSQPQPQPQPTSSAGASGAGGSGGAGGDGDDADDDGSVSVVSASRLIDDAADDEEYRFALGIAGTATNTNTVTASSNTATGTSTGTDTSITVASGASHNHTMTSLSSLPSISASTAITPVDTSVTPVISVIDAAIATTAATTAVLLSPPPPSTTTTTNGIVSETLI